MSVRSMRGSVAPPPPRGVSQRLSYSCPRSHWRPTGKQPPGALCELRELVYRYRTKTDADGSAMQMPRPLSDVDTVADVLRRLLEDEAVEVFGVLCLSPSLHPICWHEVARGSLDTVAFRLREVFKPAILANAGAVVAAHNHPTGEPSASVPDFSLTRQLVRAGSLLGITVLDHIVIGYRCFESLRRLHPALFPNRRGDE